MKLTNSGMCRLYKLYTFLIYVIPMTVLFITKHDAFSSQGGVFGFWGIIVLILCVLMFKEFVASFFKKQPIISVSIVLLVIGLFAEFLASYLSLIGIVSSAAGVASSAVSVVADVYSQHSYKTIDGEKIINKGVALSQKEAWREAYGYNFFASNDGGGE
ncbi:MAG: hypothetical protein II988_06600 [Clostridia bacterium]|nr:hypothetical protein [Clostridia bacterium]MBQ3597459.1 hypothetical protein [Clostridia bacterium]